MGCFAHEMEASYPILLKKGINYVFHTGGDTIRPLRDMDRAVTAADDGQLEELTVEEFVVLDMTGHTGTFIMLDAINGLPELSDFVRECYRQADQFFQITGYRDHTVPYHRHSVLFRVVWDDNNVARGAGRVFLISDDGIILYRADLLGIES